MATVSTRTLWKGAISFGLVHIPVQLHSAVEDNRQKMRMIDQGSMSPIGHKNISKGTGEAVAQEDIVKGLEVEKDQYVTLTKEEIREALPKTTQTIEIEAFCKVADVPMLFFSRPYYVSPVPKGHKPYALLRDVLKRTGRVGVARVVIQTKQHLAVVAPYGHGLIVNLVRWASEVRDMKGLALPGDASSVGITEREMKMGEQLVLDLETGWHPEEFKDDFSEKLEEIVAAKKKAGKVTPLRSVADEILPATADVLDLTELLKRSLRPRSSKPERDQTEVKPKRGRTAAANDEEASKRAVAASRSSTRARASVKPKGRKSE